MCPTKVVLLLIERITFKKCVSKTDKQLIARSICMMEMWIGRGAANYDHLNLRKQLIRG